MFKVMMWLLGYLLGGEKVIVCGEWLYLGVNGVTRLRVRLHFGWGECYLVGSECLLWVRRCYYTAWGGRFLL